MDAEILLGHALCKPKSWLLAHPEYILSGKEILDLNTLLGRRKTGEPIAYILAKCEFYGRGFVVNKNTLVPRPESETIIDMLLQECAARSHRDTGVMGSIDSLTIIDVGTGSGALGITATLEINKLRPQNWQQKIALIDIDPNCLEVAQINANNFGIDAHIVQGNLLSPILNSEPKTRHLELVILANLPYVPDNYEINNSANHEPRLALFGGPDGLDLYRKMFAQLKSFVCPSVVVITESLLFQHVTLTSIASQNGYKLANRKDLVQSFTNTKN